MKDWVRKYWFEIVLVCAGSLVACLGIGGLVLGIHLGGSESRAYIGDFVGGTTTPVLTALTFIGVLSGIALQRRELIATRHELELTRHETTKSAAALTSQAEAIAVQNFERTLFESLSFLNSIATDLTYGSNNTTSRREGREAFAPLYSGIANNLKTLDLPSEDLENARENPRLNQVVRSVTPKLGPYFRTLYNILRYIEDSEFSDRNFYPRIVRAQLDDFFLAILFYNSLSEVGHKFQKYIVRFNLLDNLPEHLVVNDTHHRFLALLQKRST